MLKVRNTLVALRLIVDHKEKKHGAIFVNTNTECFTEAEVVAVGPGNVSAAGGLSETADLRIGQRVLVEYKKKFNNGGGLVKYQDAGMAVRYEDTDYMFFEQTSVLAILSQPEEKPFAALLDSAYTLGELANIINPIL